MSIVKTNYRNNYSNSGAAQGRTAKSNYAVRLTRRMGTGGGAAALLRGGRAAADGGVDGVEHFHAVDARDCPYGNGIG
jgi:hypothetical protein